MAIQNFPDGSGQQGLGVYVQGSYEGNPGYLGWVL